MYGYSASSASATQLSTFNPPQQNTNPSGEAGQSAAVGQATGTAAGNAQSTIQQAFSAVPSALQSAAAADRGRRPCRHTRHDQRPDLDFRRPACGSWRRSPPIYRWAASELSRFRSTWSAR